MRAFDNFGQFSDSIFVHVLGKVHGKGETPKGATFCHWSPQYLQVQVHLSSDGTSGLAVISYPNSVINFS